MLESLAGKRIREPVSGRVLALSPSRRCSFRAALRESPDGGPFELSGGTKSRFFPPVKGIAEHLGHRGVSAQKVYLETMCLFSRAHLCVDAPDVRF
jgi:hypothetical protein